MPRSESKTAGREKQTFVIFRNLSATHRSLSKKFSVGGYLPLGPLKLTLASGFERDGPRHFSKVPVLAMHECCKPGSEDHVFGLVQKVSTGQP